VPEREEECGRERGRKSSKSVGVREREDIRRNMKSVGVREREE
jgi:hypothetical protein